MVIKHVDDWKLKILLAYCNTSNDKCIYLSLTFDDFVKDEDKIPNIDWRKELWSMIGWFNYGNGGQNRLKEVYDEIKIEIKRREQNNN